MNLELSHDAGLLLLDALAAGEREGVAEVTEVVEPLHPAQLCRVDLEQNIQSVSSNTNN